MTDDVITWISRELDESELDDEAGLVVLGALEGEHELAASLDGGYQRPDTATAEQEDVDANEVFLQSVQVEAFRGIGPTTRIDFQPGPGLTIVAGRNGSGKSSLAEAFELALTGGTYRWKNRAEQWRGQWRNVHHSATPVITVGLLEQGHGSLDVGVTWPSDPEDVNTATFHHQRKGEKKVDGTAALGWQGPLTQFRPMLSYDELGGLLDGRPSDLYDAIASVLGVEQVSDALKRIQERIKEPKKAASELSKRRRDLADQAKGVDDDRAAAAAKLLRSTDPDLEALHSIVSGTADTNDPGGLLGRLRALTELPTDWLETTLARTEALRAAVTGLADAGGAFGELRLRALDLRQQAVELHDQFGDQDCPVCQTGRLDGDWAARTAEVHDQEQEALAAVSSARAGVDRTTGQLRALGARTTTSLEPVGIEAVDTVLARARTVWDRWQSAPQATGDRTATLLALADHHDAVAPDLVEALTAVVEASRSEYDARQKAWEPVAVTVAAWCADWEGHQDARERLDKLTRAEKWLKDNDLRLKNERIAPLRDQARHAWSLLRQESNVEINNLELEGAATRRRIRIDTTIDGAEAGSLAVLSQGEMHALALALFLPRATMAESPFRFVVLDDPVQAMDPAKVDGLVDLLSELAETRQVIVFSHDDRLPEAARRAKVGARIIEVIRGTDSVVSIRSAVDPATRYLGDAHALRKDHDLPEATLRRTLPGLLRFAVEAAAREKYFSRRLQAGDRITDVEQDWQDTKLTRNRVSLGLYGEVRPSIDSWLDQYPGRKRKLALGIVGPGMHAGLKYNVGTDEAVDVVSTFVKDLREQG